MKQVDLLDIIGDLDEELLCACESTVRPRSGRLAWRILLAAALIGTVCMGAAAVSQYFTNQNNAQPEISYDAIAWKFMVLDDDGEYTGESGAEKASGVVIRANLVTDPESPIRPEVTFSIRVPEEWVLAGAGYALTGKDLGQYDMIWEPYADADGVVSSSFGPDGCQSDDYVHFRQESAYFYNHFKNNQLDSLTAIPSRVKVNVKVVTIAGISMIRADIPPFTLTQEERLESTIMTPYMRSGETRLYWSDGSSILSLVCPGWMEDSQIEDLVRSIWVVEDIQTYLDELAEQYQKFMDERTE